mmetsp:Transcript_38546/g.87598  ORF Transcript_38546/g.87598 Transcript_38546/m.87598 type:complete len:375 (-) Transcript_38546:111-1235(-)
MLAMTLLGSVLVTPARLYFLSATRWHFSAHTSLAFAFERQTVALLCTSLKPARLWLSSAAHLALRSHRLGFQLRCTRHLLDLDSRAVLRHIARSGRAEPDDDGDADEDHRGERRHDNAKDALVPVGCVIATITSRRHGINAWLHPRNGRPIGTPHTAHLIARDAKARVERLNGPLDEAEAVLDDRVGIEEHVVIDYLGGAAIAHGELGQHGGGECPAFRHLDSAICEGVPSVWVHLPRLAQQALQQRDCRLHHDHLGLRESAKAVARRQCRDASIPSGGHRHIITGWVSAGRASNASPELRAALVSQCIHALAATAAVSTFERACIERPSFLPFELSGRGRSREALSHAVVQPLHDILTNDHVGRGLCEKLTSR